MTTQTFILNNRSYPYKEGLTVKSLMEENNFEFPSIIVKINGGLIDDSERETAKINAGDDVQIIHIFGGG